MTIDGENYKITAGSGVFVPPFAIHSFHSPEPNTCQVLMFVKDLLPEFFDFLNKNQAQSYQFQYSPLSCQAVQMYLPNDTTELDIFHATAVLSPLVCDILDQCDFSPCPYRQDVLFYKTASYINDHFTEDITLKSVAQAIGIHPVTLSKLFAEKFRNSFPSYLNHLRCYYAATLLKTSNCTCSEISYQAGFGSIRSFNRIFFSFYGITPTEFRKR
jgi:AraC-like DNA-binding protein